MSWTAEAFVKNPDSTGLYLDTYKKWCRMLRVTNIICAFVVFFTEVGMYFVFKSKGLFLHSESRYLVRFLILPTLIDAVILYGGAVLEKKYQGRERLLNYIPVVQMTLMCFMVTSVHHVFDVTFCTYCLPIFLTVIFSDRKMTRQITALSFVFLTLSQFIGPGVNGYKSPYFFPEYLVAVVVLVAAGLTCRVLVKFEEEKNDRLREIYQKQVQMVEQLNLDQKTGLYGSTAFFNQLGKVVDGVTLPSVPALAVFDIDNFKSVNDSYGHANGDRVILTLAGLMKEKCPSHFLPVRFGGEEFAIVFVNGRPEEYIELTESIRREFARAEYDFTDRTITLSAGIAIWQDGWDCDAFFDHADAAMYEAKTKGKNCTVIYDGRQKGKGGSIRYA